MINMIGTVASNAQHGKIEKVDTAGQTEVDEDSTSGHLFSASCAVECSERLLLFLLHAYYYY